MLRFTFTVIVTKTESQRWGIPPALGIQKPPSASYRVLLESMILAKHMGSLREGVQGGFSPNSQSSFILSSAQILESEHNHETPKFNMKQLAAGSWLADGKFSIPHHVHCPHHQQPAGNLNADAVVR